MAAPSCRLAPDLAICTQEDKWLTARPEPLFKFNVIGTGINGQEHIKVTHLEGRATIHGLYDPNPGSIAMAKKANAQFDPHTELVVYDTLEAACFDEEVDGLIICTPNYTHREVLEVAIRSGKHLLVEKPIATTVADAYTITEMADGVQRRLSNRAAISLQSDLH